MEQPPASGRGRGEEPGRDARLPDDAPGTHGAADARGGRGDPQLADFVKGGPGDTCPPGPDLAAVLAALSSPDWRCPGATDEELVGLLRRWAALESWAAAGKLGVVRELIRRRALPGGRHGDLPDLWEDDLSHEITPALGISLPAAGKLANLAWELGARLPGIGAALAADANIKQRARQYKAARIYPDARMDQLRVLAFLDILNHISAADRIAQAEAEAEAEAEAGTRPPAGAPAPAGAPEDRPRGDAGPGNDGDGSGTAALGAGPAGLAGPVLPARSNLTLPLATLLGLAERPGEAHGIGVLDPALVRGLAAAATRSPHTDWCITITDDHGYAIGHGCARPARTKSGTSPPARTRDGPWALTLPYDQGGRTCACNAGARSRRCHKVKQSRGWKLTQPRPGWHEWTAPSGRTYTQGPMKYPA